MKQVFAGIGIFLAILIVSIGLGYVFGWNDVFYTKTVGKAKQNAERTVFEETQSYVEGKRQEARAQSEQNANVLEDLAGSQRFDEEGNLITTSTLSLVFEEFAA